LILLLSIAITGIAATSPARTQLEILADLAEAELPKVDVAATADPVYAANFAKQRDEVRLKRAQFIWELYKAAPDTPEIARLLTERWQTLVQQKQVEQALLEMNTVLESNAESRLKAEVAFLRAQAIIQKPATTRLDRQTAIDEFKPYAKYDTAAVKLPQLMYWAAKMETDPKAKEWQLAKVVGGYPNAPVTKVIKGITRRKDAIGKTMSATFNDAITGTPIDLADFRGKVVVVDFWAAWCTDCAAEMPNMKKIYADYEDKGVVFVGVSLDLPESEGGLDALKKGVARHQLKWPQYYLGREWDSDFSSEWGVYAIPAVFVLDQQGKVVNTDASGKLETILPPLLKAAAAR
jgi:thiol-disulfide isomerase/thioredoxin